MFVFNEFNAKGLLAAQSHRAEDHIPITVTVPALAAGGVASQTAQVMADADFVSLGLTCAYTTLDTVGGVPKDTGTCQLTCIIKDQQRVIFHEDFTPLFLFATPGRVRAAGIVLASGSTDVEPSGQIFGWWPFEHVFPAKGVISVEVHSQHTYANTAWFCFIGYRDKGGPIQVRARRRTQ